MDNPHGHGKIMAIVWFVIYKLILATGTATCYRDPNLYVHANMLGLNHFGINHPPDVVYK